MTSKHTHTQFNTIITDMQIKTIMRYHMLSRLIKKIEPWTSLMAQWLRICLPIRRHRFNPWSEKIPYISGQQPVHNY